MKRKSSRELDYICSSSNVLLPRLGADALGTGPSFRMTRGSFFGMPSGGTLLILDELATLISDTVSDFETVASNGASFLVVLAGFSFGFRLIVDFGGGFVVSSKAEAEEVPFDRSRRDIDIGGKTGRAMGGALSIVANTSSVRSSHASGTPGSGRRPPLRRLVACSN